MCEAVLHVYTFATGKYFCNNLHVWIINNTLVKSCKYDGLGCAYMYIHSGTRVACAMHKINF